MDSISISNGLILTVISIVVVFIILASIWGLIEIVSRFVNGTETVEESVDKQTTPVKSPRVDSISPNRKYQLAAEMMALILASEDEPDKKFEIVESKRVK